jgi:hypothetical protein
MYLLFVIVGNARETRQDRDGSIEEGPVAEFIDPDWEIKSNPA